MSIKNTMFFNHAFTTYVFFMPQIYIFSTNEQNFIKKNGSKGKIYFPYCRFIIIFFLTCKP